MPANCRSWRARASTSAGFTAWSISPAEDDVYRVVATIADGEAGSPLRFSATLADNQSATISVPGKLGEPGYSLEISRSGDKLILTEAGRSSDEAVRPEM